MMSRPVPAPRTNAGKQVARFTLEKVSVVPEGTSKSTAAQKPSTECTLAGSKDGVSENPQAPGHKLSSRTPVVGDLNLTALISEVERDIWLLEQLENNSSTKRALHNPLELPFPVTEEILKLPGYKPARSKVDIEGIIKSIFCT